MNDSPRLAGASGRIRRLALKELRETLRDRRTMITLVLMPVLIYPLLSLVFQKFLVTSLKSTDETVYRIGYDAREDRVVVTQLLRAGDEFVRKTERNGDEPPDEDAKGGVSADLEEHFELIWCEDLERAVARMDVDVGIRVRHLPGGQANGEAIDCQLSVLRTSRTGLDAAYFIERRLSALQNQALEGRLRQMGAREPLLPLTYSSRRIAPRDGSTAFSLSALVPLILILMTITGAVYPAIDLTAGERERGTLESLIAAPVPRMGLLLAKYVAVVAVALLTATVNLVSMVTTIWSVGLGPVLFGAEGLTFRLTAEVFGLLVLFAAFFSALLLAVTSFARSFKEAQAYLIPLMLLSIAPGIVSLLPGVRLDAPLAVTPLLNIVLLARDLCEQNRADPVLSLVVVVSTGLFAAAALAVAARIFGADAILYGSRGSWSELFQRPESPSPAPTAATALFCLAMLFPAYFLMSHFVARMGRLSISVRLASSATITALLFAGLPVAAAVARRVRLPGGLGLRGFRWPAFVGAVLLGMSLWAFVFEFVATMKELGIVPLDPALEKLARSLANDWKTVSPWLLVLTMGVVPAVCEELFFRGFLLGALRTRLAPWAAIVASAVLFGAFHLVMAGALANIRFIPSTLLGLALGWVCVRTGSVVPGMLIHAIHNSLLVTLSHFRDDLIRRGWDIAEASHLPVPLLAGAAALVVLGAAMVRISEPQAESAQPG